MGITRVAEDIFNTFRGNDPRHTLWHGHSFTANPLGCAAANASLDLLEKTPQLYKEFENRHIPHLKNLAKHSKVSHPRVTGTIAAFDLVTEGEKGYLNIAGKIIKNVAISKGVLIRPLGDVVYLLPPLCITEDQLEECYAAIESGLNAL